MTSLRHFAGSSQPASCCFGAAEPALPAAAEPALSAAEPAPPAADPDPADVPIATGVSAEADPVAAPDPAADPSALEVGLASLQPASAPSRKTASVRRDMAA